MISYSISEWGSLPIGTQAGCVTRGQADRLLAIAREASWRLGLGKDTGDSVLSDGRNTLRAGQVVGVIAARDVTLEILPKIDGHDSGAIRHNLVRMLARVLDLPVAEGTMIPSAWQRYDLLEIVIRLFCDKLFEAVHRGLPRRYVPHEADLPALRGRLDAIRQFTVLAVTPQRLACRYDELSPDIPLNQIIKATVTLLRRISRQTESQRRLFELQFAFSEVGTIPTSRLPWSAVILDRTNRHWADLLRLSKLFLNERFQTTGLGSSGGFSLLFEMNTLFEEFVGRSLQVILRRLGKQVSLQGPSDHALRDMDGKGRLQTRPDIVVLGPAGANCIVDTKWKRLKPPSAHPTYDVSPADVYQMMAYAQVYQCPNVTLLYPHHDGIGTASGFQAEYLIAGGHATRLVVATLDLSNFDSIPAQLASLFASQETTTLQPHE